MFTILVLFDQIAPHVVFRCVHKMGVLYIWYADEHSKGTVDKNHGVEEFRNCTEQLDMDDIVMNGIFFSWASKEKGP